MMRQSLYSGLLGLLAMSAMATGVLRAQQPDTSKTHSADSARVQHAGEVIVTGQSLLARAAESPRSVSVLSREQIEAGNAADLSDAVAYVPGVFVKQYGGLGGLRTVSLRGTSSQQTVVLIDGVRYMNSSATGFDLGTIPAAALERVEVVRGGDAAIYGPNSLGGVINVITGAVGRAPLNGSAYTAIGSFGERQFGGGASGTAGNHQWDASLNAVTTEGNYPFTFNEFGGTTEIERGNGDFTNLYGRVGWKYQGDEGGGLAISAQGYNSERGVPGAVVQGNREQLRARLAEQDLFMVGQASYTDSLWQGGISISGRLNHLQYRDPDLRVTGPDGVDNIYDRRELAVQLRGRRFIGGQGLIEATSDVAHAQLEGDNLDPSAGSSVARTEIGAILRGEWAFGAGYYGQALTLDAGLRFDYFSDIESSTSPSLGLLWQPAELPLRFRAHAALTYRAPSFTELYYLNYGNADLQPERSKSLDVGATYNWNGLFLLQSSMFVIDTRDQILSIPKSPVQWSATNVARTLSRGIEISGTGKLFDDLVMLNCSYTRMRTENRTEGALQGETLPYSPEELLNAVIQVRFGRYAVGGTFQYASHRYTLQINTPESALPHYAIVGANVSGQWAVEPVDIGVRLEVLNLFGAEYEVVRNHPMPGRMFRVRTDIRFSAKEGE